MDMLAEFQSMSDGHLDCSSVAKYRARPQNPARSLGTIPYRAKDARLRENLNWRGAQRQLYQYRADKMGTPIASTFENNVFARFCVDYRQLDTVTKRDSYSMTGMDKCTDSLGETAIFSELDANRGY